MFDPYAAFALRVAPLLLEVYLDVVRQNVCVKPTHTVCIDVNEDAVCLLLHKGTLAHQDT